MYKNILINNTPVAQNYVANQSVKNLYRYSFLENEETIPITVQFDDLPNNIGESISLLDIGTILEDFIEEETSVYVIGYAFANNGIYVLLWESEFIGWYPYDVDTGLIGDGVTSYIDYENPTFDSQGQEDYPLLMDHDDFVYMYVGLVPSSSTPSTPSIVAIFNHWPDALSTLREK